MSFIKELLYRLRGEFTTEKLISMGMKVGKNFNRLHGVILDPGHCWLIDIGDNVTIAPRVHILCHDASTKQFLNYTKIGRVTIGNNVVIGANSTVTHSIPDNSVAVGSPARVISTLDDYLAKETNRMKSSPCYGEEYTLRKNISSDMKAEQKNALSGKIGFVD